jgi:FSR family fosmidomycin resistance protein-like MFS transporter
MGHLVNDLYGTVLPPLYPILMRLYGLSYSLVGVYAAAYLISSAILQPFFGHVFDRLRPRAMLPLSVLIGGLGVGLLGLVRNYGLSLLCTAAAGTGSAIFHPVASAYSSYESRRRGALLLDLHDSWEGWRFERSFPNPLPGGRAGV